MCGVCDKGPCSQVRPLQLICPIFHDYPMTASSVSAHPCAQGIGIFCHLMIPARNSRIILASNRIFALTPIGTVHQTHAPNISLLFSEQNDSCIALTPEGVLFVLNVPSSISDGSSGTGISTTTPSLPRDNLTSIGHRCMPVTALDAHHSMHAASACLLNAYRAQQGSQMQQPPISDPAIIIYFAPPPIPSNGPIALRVQGRAEAGRRGSGCLQAHSVPDGQLLRVFEGCGDDINCVAVSSGDKTIGRYLLAGSDQEGGGATLFMWPLLPAGDLSAAGDRLVPLLISVQAEKVYPACGAITCIVGRATDVILAFAGGKIAIFSLVSRSFKCDRIYTHSMNVMPASLFPQILH